MHSTSTIRTVAAAVSADTMGNCLTGIAASHMWRRPTRRLLGCWRRGQPLGPWVL
jgi:hypothetical protein